MSTIDQLVGYVPAPGHRSQNATQSTSAVRGFGSEPTNGSSKSLDSMLRIRNSWTSETPSRVRQTSCPSMRKTYLFGVHSTENTWKLSHQVSARVAR